MLDADLLVNALSALEVGQFGEALEPATTWAKTFDQQFFASIAIVCLAAFVQATVGFAAALLGLPLLLWAGNDLMTSQVMIITAMMPQNILSVWKLRKSINVREVLLPAAIRISALPIGIAGLSVVMTWTSAGVNQLVGAIILFALAIQALIGIEWKNARKLHWLIATFGGSGILQGLSGMSGPPMVLWVHGQRFSADHARGFLFSMYISNFIPQMLMLFAKFGTPVISAATTALFSIPLVLISASLGLKLGSWFGDRRLRPLTYCCLFALAICSVLRPWLNF
ncbi:MAG: sulfite exporter TauE/SafE family protein [Aureliella sp.]